MFSNVQPSPSQCRCVPSVPADFFLVVSLLRSSGAWSETGESDILRRSEWEVTAYHRQPLQPLGSLGDTERPRTGWQCVRTPRSLEPLWCWLWTGLRSARACHRPPHRIRDVSPSPGRRAGPGRNPALSGPPALSVCDGAGSCPHPPPPLPPPNTRRKFAQLGPAALAGLAVGWGGGQGATQVTRSDLPLVNLGNQWSKLSGKMEKIKIRFPAGWVCSTRQQESELLQTAADTPTGRPSAWICFATLFISLYNRCPYQKYFAWCQISNWFSASRNVSVQICDHDNKTLDITSTS